jgi:hypothetical protein
VFWAYGSQYSATPTRTPLLAFNPGQQQHSVEYDIKYDGWFYEIQNKTKSGTDCLGRWSEYRCLSHFMIAQKLDYTQAYSGVSVTPTAVQISAATIASLPVLYIGTTPQYPTMCQSFYTACHGSTAVDWTMCSRNKLGNVGMYDTYHQAGPILTSPLVPSTTQYNPVLSVSLYGVNSNSNNLISAHNAYFQWTASTVCPPPFTENSYLPSNGWTNIIGDPQSRCNWGCVPGVIYREDEQSVMDVVMIVFPSISLICCVYLLFTWLWIPKKRKETFIILTILGAMGMTLLVIVQWAFRYNSHYMSSRCYSSTMLVLDPKVSC